MNRQELIAAMKGGSDFVILVIEKDDVDSLNTKPIEDAFNLLMSDKILGRHYREKIDISFNGFSHRGEELWEITEVRDYIRMVDNKCPYWLYFLSKEGQGLRVVLKSFLLPYISPEAETTVNGPKLKEYLERRGFPASNHLCELHGVSEIENERMTQRLVKYLSRPHQS